MKKIKNEKGAISLFALLSMLFFLAFMIGVFAIVSRRNAIQLEAVRETTKIYASGVDADETYNSLVASDNVVIPITLLQDLKNVKDIIISGGAASHSSNGKVYTYRREAHYVLLNDIILDFKEELNGKNDIEIYDYLLYDSTYNIDMNNYNIYYRLEDGSFWKCVFYHNLGTSGESNTFSMSGTEIPGKSYSAKKYSILASNLNSFKREWDGVNSFEFLLTYSLDSGKFNAEKYQRWRQGVNPTEYTEVMGEFYVPGYDDSYEDAKVLTTSGGLGTEHNWGGLALSTDLETYIDGSIGSSDNYFAVGVYGWPTSGGIPTNSGVAKEEILFVRVK